MQQTTQPKRLYRSRKERLIAGVCGGLGNYFEIDPTWVRILFIVLLLLAGTTLIVYIILWVIVPPEPLLPTPIVSESSPGVSKTPPIEPTQSKSEEGNKHE